VLLPRIHVVLHNQVCINHMYQRFAACNERMNSAERSSTRMNYYVSLEDDETLSFKKNTSSKFTIFYFTLKILLF